MKLNYKVKRKEAAQRTHSDGNFRQTFRVWTALGKHWTKEARTMLAGDPWSAANVTRRVTGSHK